ncbi:MAG: di-trans,poly-cis-decaprenylcistransferase [Candidatus Thermoplasmatota archaeon]|nr:di-trans,poly-cis-decaprenylcistransferase [Candidatus Thermoplasmatota archaeon]MCG2825333.1 polyprenyl diphosphate synthase [Thermoplasmatales archaeon]
MSITKAVSNIVYNTYERKLLNKVLNAPVPKHLAIIMDGNRRFAQKLGMDPAIGHLAGSDKLEEVMNWCIELGINVLTVYAFSTENIKRNKDEADFLMNLFAENFRKVGDDERVHKNKMRIKAIGKIENLPKNVQDAIKYAEEKTKNYDKYFFNIAVAYGGREEILNAVKRIAGDVKKGKIKEEDINEKLMSSYLYTSDLPDPDLILRTSGEERISNFLLWQLAYSELYFSDVYWPGFRKIDFLRAIKSYQERKRRFGE